MRMINIAIDGPSAAGKSTIAQAVSRELGYVHLDTGAMYRCIGLKCLEKGIGTKDAAAVTGLLKDTEIDQTADGRCFLDGADVSDQIRTDTVSMAASDVSTLKEVRADLVRRQQLLSARKGFVLDGRDIGTVVLKDAEVKIFMTASVMARAKRRYEQNLAGGLPADLAKIAEEIAERDYQDIHRKESPLTQAPDAVLIDTSDLTIEQVRDKVLELARKAIGKDPQ